ncbi:MAG TPA: selenocysteine-specific translation elongation factor [Candidatus Pelethomonas intestinigallinarum]|nr:selenocysteine-specific translation elongation factor [Candidatus Pelethomonas intestinigallinarum]
MKHVIIGTAGHVDHGKTLLVKALTGIDTDRLVEEKKRGITIELGFAHLDFDDGTQAGIVDVPGHEKFIKNMLAGAGGIDLAMLVVAADEGFMPQTVEHLGILSLLGIQDGLVVITKCDMADPEWVEMVKEDVRTHVEGTFLEGKPVFTVSAYTGQGIPELRQALKELVQKAAEKNMRTPFRLPIDRVFSVDGFGTVVTGTLIEGSVSNGDMAEILPGGVQARVRNLQVHDRDVETAYAGQRVAINLAGVKKADLGRGDVIARPGSVRTSLMLDARLQNLKNSQRTILSGSQVHLYHGSAVRLCKVVLLDRDALQPGESCYAQLRLTEEIAAKRGDRFVIRFYSPLETIGGGVVLDDLPRRHKRGDQAVLEALAIRESGSGDDQLVQLVAEHGHSLPTLEKLAAPQNLDREELGRSLEELTSAGKVLQPLPGRYLAASVFDAIWDSCRGLLEQYHRQNPLHAGMKVAELRQKLLKNTDQAVADAILAALAREGKIKAVADRYALADFAVHLTKRQSAIREKLLQTYRKAGLEVPGLDEVIASFPPAEQGDCRQVVESLVSGGGLVMLTPQLCLHSQVYAQVCDKTRDFMAEHQELTLAEFRDLLGTSRKYALAVLEYYDKNKILKKDGDVRRLGTGF